MNNEDAVYLKIDQYLKGELEEVALSEFENEIRRDATLQAKVNSWKMANELVLEHRLLNVSATLSQVHMQTKRTRQLFKLALVGALIALTILAIFLIKSQDKKINSLPLPITEKENSENSEGVKSPTVSVSKKGSSSSTTSDVVVESKSEDNTTLTNVQLEVENSKLIQEKEKLPVPQEETENPAKDKVVDTRKSDCLDNPLKVELRTNASCAGKNTGSVFLKEISGGEKPYHMFVIGRDGDKSANNRNLGAGTYYAEITDNKNCSVKEKFVISSQNCSVDYAFNPGIGEELEIPEYAFDGELSIQDVSGKSVFQKHVSAGNSVYWNGYTNLGELKPGYYQYKIEYRDNTVHTGTITVVP